MPRSLLPALRLLTMISNELPARHRPPRKASKGGGWGSEWDRPKVRHADLVAFRNYAPTYYTKVGPVTCKLGKVAIGHSGRPVGQYRLVVHDPVYNVIETTLYLYELQNGRFFEVKKYPSQTRRWR